jgi:hypothetical protein
MFLNALNVLTNRSYLMNVKIVLNGGIVIHNCVNLRNEMEFILINNNGVNARKSLK